MINSKREYRIITVVRTNSSHIMEHFTISLNDLIQEGNETAYALQEQIDEVMDIPEDCSMYFTPVRGDLGAKGIIIRIK